MTTQRVNPETIRADPKRIIIACDGTWDDDNYGMEKKSILPWSKETAKPSSNVTRLCRSILPFDTKARKQQITYYQAGVGSENTIKDKLWGGLTGFGISEHVREAYAFLCHNWVENESDPEKCDEIIIVGFSRGAFTARTIAAMVSDLGLLTMKGMNYFLPIFKDWENQIVPGYVSPFEEPWPPGSWPDLTQKYKINDPKTGPLYADFLLKNGYVKKANVPIKCVGVWDTVGALGIPSIGIIPHHQSMEYTFVDTLVAPNVQHAFQALALDEHRLPFTPTIWETPSGRTDLDLKQCWFPGAHANVGGGYPDTMIPDITLAWMVSRMIEANIISEAGFDLEYIRWLWQLNKQYYGNHPLNWGMGRIDESFSAEFWLTHSRARTPGQYWETNARTGEPTNTRCQGTNEHMHASVRLRKGIPGRGLDDRGVYDPPALQGWKCAGVADQKVQWILPGHDKKTMDEDQLLPLEIELMKYISPSVYDTLWKIQGSAW